MKEFGKIVLITLLSISTAFVIDMLVWIAKIVFE